MLALTSWEDWGGGGIAMCFINENCCSKTKSYNRAILKSWAVSRQIARGCDNCYEAPDGEKTRWHGGSSDNYHCDRCTSGANNCEILRSAEIAACCPTEGDAMQVNAAVDLYSAQMTRPGRVMAPVQCAQRK